MKKYTFWELMLCNYFQCIRKKSKGFWVRQKGKYSTWVKFTDKDLKAYNGAGFFIFSNIPEYEVEDWRNQ